MPLKWLPVYFVLGGGVVVGITYLGTHSKGFLAAILAFLPTISLITLAAIYQSEGQQAAISYAKGMLVLLPAWCLYVLAVILLMPRIGLVWSLVTGTLIYLGAAFLTRQLVQGFV